MLASRFLQPPARQWVEVAWVLTLLRHSDATHWPQNQKRHPGPMAVRHSPPLDQPPAVTAVLSRLRETMNPTLRQRIQREGVRA